MLDSSYRGPVKYRMLKLEQRAAYTTWLNVAYRISKRDIKWTNREEVECQEDR